jgi:thiol-disulfide isomerase/thioredoxin
MSDTSSSSSSATGSKIASSITNAISSNYKNIIIVFVILAVIGGVFYYVYTNNLIPGMNKFFQQAQGKTVTADGNDVPGEKTAQLYLFKVDWCPHCKKAGPVFDEVEKELKGEPVKGYVVSFKTIDCEADPEMADKFKVDGYPTIKLVKDGEIIEYDAKPEKDKIIEFLNTVL